MTRVISFGLWGDAPRYVEGAEANVVLARTFYPGWQCWFFCDQTVPADTLTLLSGQSDCRVIISDSTRERQDRLFWRFWAASYEEVDTMIVRDADSRIGRREQLAVLEWLRGGAGFHVMRDSAVHGVPMCGGMWGCHANRLRHIRHMIDAYYEAGGHRVVQCGVDQDFLHQMVWPLAARDCTEHDEFFVGRPFPRTRRNDRLYVGRIFAPDDPDYRAHTPRLRSSDPAARDRS